MTSPDPNAECTPYYYAPVAKSTHRFPPIWQPATLLQDDTEGQALWANISGNIPDIPPKGQLNGSTISVTYDSVNDPACCKWNSYPCFAVALETAEDHENVWFQVTSREIASWTSLNDIVTLDLSPASPSRLVTYHLLSFP
jgi:hypothetical protein